MKLSTNINKIFNNKLYYKFLITYIIILLIPLIFGTIAYNNAQQTIKEYAVQSNLTMLNKTKEVIEQKLQEIDNIVTVLLNNKKIQQYKSIKEPFKGSTPYKVIKVEDELVSYDIVNKYILSYYIFYKNSNIAVSPSLIYKLPQFYQQYLQYEGIEYKNWYNDFINKYHKNDYLPSRTVFIKDNKYSVITYLKSLDYQGSGVLMVLIDNREIKNLLMGHDIEKGGWAFIADSHGNIITGTENTEFINEALFKKEKGFFRKEINGESHLVTYTVSPDNGWYYVTGQPLKLVMNNLNRIKKITIIILLVTILFGILVAGFLANKNSRPIQDLVRLIKDRSMKNNLIESNSLRYLRKAVVDLIKDNKNLETSIREQSFFLESAFKDKLFKGEFHSLDNIKAILEYASTDIALDGNLFSVVILEIENRTEVLNQKDIKELKLKRVLTKDIIQSTINNTWDNCIIHEINENNTIILFEFNSNDRKYCKESLADTIEKIRKKLCDNYNINMSVAAGGIYDNIIDVAKSYDEARRALNYGNKENKQEISWYEKIKIDSNRYYYPIEMETRLINVIKSGSMIQMENVIENLYQENFEKRHLSIETTEEFLVELKGTIRKILEQISWENNQELNIIDSMIENINDYRKLEKKYNYTIKILNKLCNIINKCNETHQEKLKKKIITYVNNNYMKPDFGLYMIAEKFDLSEGYVSHFFKDYIGDNFQSYLEKRRMDRACKLLIETNYTVKKIAGKAGYNSSSTFSRAFKRNKGISPSIYRENNVYK